MIPYLREALEEIESWPEIGSIIPGAITRKGKHRGKFQLRVQYLTQTGLKCLALSGNAIQEVFFVTADGEELKKRLQKQFTLS